MSRLSANPTMISHSALSIALTNFTSRPAALTV